MAVILLSGGGRNEADVAPTEDIMQKYFTPKFIVPSVIVAIIGLAIVWYLVSPLFINVAVSEAPPSGVVSTPAASTASPTSVLIGPAVATAAMQQAMSE